METPAQPDQLYEGKDVAELGLGTKLNSLHLKGGHAKNSPVITPIYHSANYHARDCEGFEDQMNEGYVYYRNRNPNTDEVEMIIAQTENGKGTVIFPGGMSAISNTLLCFLKPGAHVVAQTPLYSCTSYVLENICAQYGVEVSYVDAKKDVDEYRKAVKSNTTILYGEVLGNPMMYFLDVKKFGEIGKELNIMTIVDGTFAPPTNLTPLDYGVDIVIHSASKYLSGHSDLLAGCSTLNSLEHCAKLRTWKSYTSSQSAFDSVLLRRSLRTLHVRTERHNENGMAVAKYLEAHPLVTKVHYIGLESHPQHSIAAGLMKGYGGMMAIELGSQEKAVKFAEATRVFKLAISLGGAESLIEHPGTMTHNKLITSEGVSKGIPDTLLRLSIGIESLKDLIADLEQALNVSEQ